MAKKDQKSDNAIQGLFDGLGGVFGNNGWLMFLIFVLLIIGCGGCSNAFI